MTNQDIIDALAAFGSAGVEHEGKAFIEDCKTSARFWAEDGKLLIEHRSEKRTNIPCLVTQWKKNRTSYPLIASIAMEDGMLVVRSDLVWEKLKRRFISDKNSIKIPEGISLAPYYKLYLILGMIFGLMAFFGCLLTILERHA